MDKIKIFIIAGEPSGDILGAKLMSAIKAILPLFRGGEFASANDGGSSSQEVQFIGVGGKKMEDQGLNSLFPIAELSIMGFAEIVPHIPKLLKRIKQTADAIIESGANMVITIDSPDFCFRVIKKLKQSPASNNIKKVHLIAPSVWAYRPKRAEKIARLYDLLLAILPFEPPYFEKHGLETLFIGHPVTEDIVEVKEDSFRQQNQIKPNDLLICAMAGSRVSEVKRMLPEIIGAVNILSQKYHNLVVVMPIIERTRAIIEEHLSLFNAPPSFADANSLPLKNRGSMPRILLIPEAQKYSAFAASNLAIAKSGTNNLEIAMAGLPMITIYKINPLTHFLIKRMVRIKFANLINLILNYELIPELLQNNCTGEKIAKVAENLIANPDLAKKQISESKRILEMLGLNKSETPSKKAALKILSYF